MKKILIIDGSRMIWSFYRVLLKSVKNLEIYFAASLEQALEHLKRMASEGNPPDLVICEMECPGWDGMEGQQQGGVDFLKFLRQGSGEAPPRPPADFELTTLKEIPVFLVTSDDNLDKPGCGEVVPRTSVMANECFRKRDILQAANQGHLVSIIKKYLEGNEPEGLTSPAGRSPSSIKTLVVEDDPASRTVIVRYLERIGFQVAVAQTSNQALDAVREEQPDIILLDIGLPDSSGLEVVRELKSHEATRHIPIVAVSARAMEQDRQIGLEAGLDHYHTKPLDFTRLLETIEKLTGVTRF